MRNPSLRTSTPASHLQNAGGSGQQNRSAGGCDSGNREVDLKKLAKVSGNKKVEMLHLRDLEETTGYIRGGCSPIGMKSSSYLY